MEKYILGITTYNRKRRLKKLIESLKATYESNFNWKIIVADDGSSDGTLEYLKGINIPDMPIIIIRNNRQGIHHQFNTIINELMKLEFNYCFKCDDDVEFIQPGWEKLYVDAINEYGYHHLCHFDPDWQPGKNLKNPIRKGKLVSYCSAKDVQGAFFTLTPDIIKRVGYMDTKNFGFRGVGHIDYTTRACRAGYNNINHPFDVSGSNKYIKHQSGEYKSALNIHIQNALESDDNSRRKYKLIEEPSRIYIPYAESFQYLNQQTEKDLLVKRIEDLEDQLTWYKKNYDHQPKWFVRLGKILDRLNIFKH